MLQSESKNIHRKWTSQWLSDRQQLLRSRQFRVFSLSTCFSSLLKAGKPYFGDPYVACLNGPDSIKICRKGNILTSVATRGLNGSSTFGLSLHVYSTVM